MPEYFLLGLIGHPLSHSLSPALHNAALKYAGLKGEYRLIDTTQENLLPALKDIQKSEFTGFNITIPYKEDIYPLVNYCTDEAKLSGAINTVRIEKDGSLSGHNTDILGFKKALMEYFTIDLKYTNALVIGAGGSAKAVVTALCNMGIEKICIKARNDNKVNSFISNISKNLELTKTKKSKQIKLIPFDDTDNENIAIIINASPIGLNNEAAPAWLNTLLDSVTKNCICFDLVYRKDGSKPTFANLANNKGLPNIDGLPMLIHQARYAFEYWTGIIVPVQIMQEALAISSTSTL